MEHFSIRIQCSRILERFSFLSVLVLTFAEVVFVVSVNASFSISVNSSEQTKGHAMLIVFFSRFVIFVSSKGFTM